MLRVPGDNFELDGCAKLISCPVTVVKPTADLKFHENRLEHRTVSVNKEAGAIMILIRIHDYIANFQSQLCQIPRG